MYGSTTPPLQLPIRVVTSRPRVRLAVDVMGTDLGPAPMVEGALLAVKADADILCVLVGSEDALRNVSTERVTCHVAGEVIEMADEPALAVRAKRDSSLLHALQLVRLGEADAVVTASNTGAVVLAASAVLRRLPGVLHPALATVISSRAKDITVLVDSGATTQRVGNWLEQYARFGVAFAELLSGHGAHSAGLLANGVERTKGDGAVREADALLAASDIPYVGFIEPDALYEPEPTVVVTDGFMGNVMLKTIEATNRAIVAPLIDELAESRRLAGIDAPPPPSHGHALQNAGWGAALLGVQGVVVKAHGVGSARAAFGAVRLAAAAARGGSTDLVRRAIGEPGRFSR